MDVNYKKYEPKNISVIVMRPRTGEILAIANKPDFDLNKFNSTETRILKNIAVTDWFEPGSIFLPVSAAIVGNESRVEGETLISCVGRYSVYKHYYHCFNNINHGNLTLSGILENACRTGIIKSVENLDKEILYKYLVSFGFGLTTASDLNGERAGLLYKPEVWTGLSKYSISLGQELTVTALQLLNSLLVIPNGGNLLKPEIIKEIRLNENFIFQKNNEPQILRRVIKEATAEKINQYLISTVEKGTGMKARIPGIKIAGKTGATQILDENGMYSKDKSLFSFFGYFPADNPQTAILVVINTPSKEFEGKSIAAVSFKNIAEQILKKNGQKK